MTLIHALDATARRNPGRGIEFLDRRGRSAGDRRTYEQLVPSWKAGARRVVGAGARERRPVFVCLGASWEFFDVWFGALLGGALPVALAPPLVLGKSTAQFSTFAKLVERFDPALVVATELTRQRAREHGFDALVARIRTPEEVAAAEASSAPLPPPPDSEELAFLQFTSGSTGVPRAVSIPHRALLATTGAIEACTPNSAAPDGRGALVSWLPLHHDMGLVGCLLFSVVEGHDAVFLSQRTFLGRPVSWLRAAAAQPHVFCGGPNFAYQACVERVKDKDLEGLDLSTFRTAVTGSEMVRPETVEAFYERFGPAGFPRGSLVPAYGMAETTLTVTMGVTGEDVHTRPAPPDDDGGTRVVCGAGKPVPGMRVRITAPDGTELPDGEVGEVRTAGDCNFAGYYEDPEATAEYLQDGWLLTKDLGFVHEGELFITGRIKDIIIVNGNNVMPHELEWHAETVTGGGGSCRAGAFAVADPHGTEAPALVVEIDPSGEPDLGAMSREVKRLVATETGLPLADVAFVRRGSIPKTSSGKVRRAELRRLYLARELERLDGVQDAGND